MEKAHEFFVITVILMIVMGSGLFYYSFTEFKKLDLKMDLSLEELKKSVEQSNKEIIAVDNRVKDTKTAVSSLTNSVVEMSGQIGTRLDQLKEEGDANVKKLSGKISTVESQSSQKISRLEKQSSDQFKQLEKQLISINVEGADATALVQKAARATVSVHTNNAVGSGALIEPEGYIVTNAHVIQGATQGSVKTFDGVSHPVRVVFQDGSKDIAVVKIDGKFDFLRWGGKVSPGQRVFALGSPAGLEFSVSGGIVSSLREINGIHYIQTDLSLNPGNSGGPLIDPNGDLVGINNFKLKEFEGLGFAIDAETVRDSISVAIKQDKEKISVQ